MMSIPATILSCLSRPARQHGTGSIACLVAGASTQEGGLQVPRPDRAAPFREEAVVNEKLLEVGSELDSRALRACAF